VSLNRTVYERDKCGGDITLRDGPLLGTEIEQVFTKACYTLDIFPHNIGIKRYCDKEIILSHGCLKVQVSS